jgi:hypothetical protein
MVAVSMPDRPAIHLVDDPHDSLELVTRVSSLAGLAHGRAVCHPTPGTQRHEHLAADLLVCLGKRFDALRFERAQRRAWELVDVWFQAERIRHLFVLRAHRLAVPLCEMLVDLARRCRVDAWLIFGPSTGRAHLPEQLPFRRWSQASFLARWDTTNDGQAKTQSEQFPELPADDFLTFRSACRRVLDTADVERLDGVFCAAMDDTAGWLKPHTRRRSGSAGDSLDLGAVAAQIQELLCESRSASEALVRLRGAQAAYFRAGWLLDFSPQLIDPDSGLPPLGPALGTSTAARLRRLCTPRSTAAMTLRLAADLRGEGLARLNMQDIDEDGGGVTLGQHRLSIPSYARSLVRAQLVERERDGAAGSDPLFVHLQRGDRQVGSALRNVLRSVSYKTAISVGPRDSMASSSQDAQDWLRSRRARLTRLAAGPPGFSP